MLGSRTVPQGCAAPANRSEPGWMEVPTHDRGFVNCEPTRHECTVKVMATRRGKRTECYRIAADGNGDDDSGIGTHSRQRAANVRAT